MFIHQSTIHQSKNCYPHKDNPTRSPQGTSPYLVTHQGQICVDFQRLCRPSGPWWLTLVFRRIPRSLGISRPTWRSPISFSIPPRWLTCALIHTIVLAPPVGWACQRQPTSHMDPLQHLPTLQVTGWRRGPDSHALFLCAWGCSPQCAMFQKHMQSEVGFYYPTDLNLETSRVHGHVRLTDSYEFNEQNLHFYSKLRKRFWAVKCRRYCHQDCGWELLG